MVPDEDICLPLPKTKYIYWRRFIIYGTLIKDIFSNGEDHTLIIFNNISVFFDIWYINQQYF